MAGKDLELLKAKAQGRWRQILAHYGIEVSDNPKETSGCPICGPGRNNHRFRFDNKDGHGGWYCQQCGAGDGFSLLIKTGKASGFFEAIEMVERVVGEVPSDGKSNNYDHRKLLNKIWQESEILTGDDIVCKYLRSRGLSLDFLPTNIRFHQKLYESETKTEMPAMVARVDGSDGKPVTIHRTYLTPDGKKADIDAPRKLMKGTRTLGGCGIRLVPSFPDTLAVAEGIESAIAAFELSKIPTWSAVNATMLESWMPPAEPKVSNIIIFADKDENYCGQKSACVLAHRLTLAGFNVRIRMPLGYGDWLDVKNGKIKGRIS